MQSHKSLLIEKENLDPILQRIKTVHQRNKMKELLAQKSNKEYLEQFEKRKSTHCKKRQEKNQHLINKVQQQHKKLEESAKRKEEYYQKMTKKCQITIEENTRKKMKKIRDRQNKIHSKRISESNLKYQKQRFNSSEFSSKLKTFHQHSNQKQINWSDKSRNDLERKQKLATKNLKTIEDNINYYNHNMNQQKLVVKKKADQLKQHDIKEMLKKSVRKCQHYQQRSLENMEIDSNKQKKKIEYNHKQIQKVKRCRENLLADIEEKFNKIQEKSVDKTLRYSLSRSRMQSAYQQRIKKNREDISAQNSVNYELNHDQLIEKMDRLYVKDRKQWNFVTKVNELKKSLIQKNIYESSQIALRK